MKESPCLSIPTAMFNILLVDDNSLFRQALRDVLILHFPFMFILEAGNGARAMALGAEYCPQLAFINMKLPDGCGLEVVRRFKSAHPATAVCVLTQHDFPEYRFAAREYGADHFIVKGESSGNTIVSMVESTISGCFHVLLVNHTEGLRHQIDSLLNHRWPAMVVVEDSPRMAAISGSTWLQPDAVVLGQSRCKSDHTRVIDAIRHRHPNADLIIITKSEKPAFSFSPPSPYSAFLVPQNENFSERLVAVMDTIVAARSSSPI